MSSSMEEPKAPIGVVVSPAELHVLLQLYHTPDRPKRDGSYIIRDEMDKMMQRFHEQKIVVTCEEYSGWKLSERGQAWIQQILNTPYPVQVWTDPRDMKDGKLKWERDGN